MKPLIDHTSPLANVRKARQHQTPAWSFRTGVGIDITFGMPKYDCKYHGICRLDVDESHFNSPLQPSCGRGKGWLFIPRPEYGLICFDKKSMTKATLETNFQREYFVLEENLPFSEALAIRIGKQLSLLAGEYRILEKGSSYGVLFGIT